MYIDFPYPNNDEMPSDYADRLGQYYASLVTVEVKKNNGQFFTPLPIADYMAKLSYIDIKKIKILDPGCGIGILSTILIEKLSTNNKIEIIELIAFENDSNILSLTEANYENLRVWLSNKNISFSYYLCKNDFILHNSKLLQSEKTFFPEFDIVISNPPYFKLPKEDIRKEIAKSVIYGQANIYTIFMAISARLLKKNGKLVFIIPRSFCSGHYFKLFRERFFEYVDLKAIHVFKSRKNAFRRDSVLQENIIISAMRKDLEVSSNRFKYIDLSSSYGLDDLNDSLSKKYNILDLIDFNSEQKNIHLPLSTKDENIIKVLKSWTGSLRKYGLEVSTGRVVDFRNIEIIRFQKDDNTLPLLWLHNVNEMNITWPNDNYRGKPKGQYIIMNSVSYKKLSNVENMIFIRRFSSKDDTKRIIAAPFIKDYFNNFKMIGIENHLNYIYSINHILTKEQCYGLAALLNSDIIDSYFRTFNGNTNVSATELRDLPLPKLNKIEKIGKEIVDFIKNDVDFCINSLIKKNLEIPSL